MQRMKTFINIVDINDTSNKNVNFIETNYFDFV